MTFLLQITHQHHPHSHKHHPQHHHRQHLKGNQKFGRMRRSKQKGTVQVDLGILRRRERVWRKGLNGRYLSKASSTHLTLSLSLSVALCLCLSVSLPPTHPATKRRLHIKGQKKLNKRERYVLCIAYYHVCQLLQLTLTSLQNLSPSL